MKKNNFLINFLFSLAIIVIIFGSGYKLGEYRVTGSFLPVTKSDRTFKDTNFNLFWKTFDELNLKFVDKKKLDPKKMYFGAIKGMVAAVEDPYTFFLTPEENKQAKSDLEGKFEGIGAQLGLKDGRITVIAPLKKSPAENAGIRSGDFILKVDGASTSTWTLTQAVLKIRGTKGTKVKLTIDRSGKEMEFTIIRDQIIVASVELEFEKNIAYLKLNQFGESTNEDWDRAVLQIENEWNQKKIRGMILDLRDNPGGYLDSSVYLASDFLSKGELVVNQESTVTESREYTSIRNGRLMSIPLVVLINGGSASASEILAGALRDHKKGVLIGEKSFGKGSVQEALDLDEGAGLHVTVAKWILPKGDWINAKGIKPDIEVKNEIKEGNTLTKETDLQLDRAFKEVLN